MKKLNLLATGLLFSIAALAQNTGTLNLTKGKVYSVESKILTNNKTNMMGQEMDSKADIIAVYEIAIEGTSGNQYQVGSTVKSMKMNMSMMGQEMKFDSQDSADATGPLGGTVKDLLNKEQKITIDKSGKVLAGINDSSALAPELKQMENSGFGTNLAFIALPANLKVGDTWTAGNDTSAAIQTTTHYTVKSITGNLMNLDFTGETKTTMTLENQGMEVLTKTTGAFEGNATVERSGVVQTSKSTGKASGTVSVMGQEMPLDVNVTSETTVKEVK